MGTAMEIAYEEENENNWPTAGLEPAREPNTLASMDEVETQYERATAVAYS